MRTKSALLLSAIFLGALSTSAFAKPDLSIVAPEADPSKDRRGDLTLEIPLKDMMSPSLRWSHMSFDALKSSGLDVAASEMSTAELLNKSEEIHLAAVAQIAPAGDMPTNEDYRLLSGLLIFISGCMMWMCLTLKRPE